MSVKTLIFIVLLIAVLGVGYYLGIGAMEQDQELTMEELRQEKERLLAEGNDVEEGSLNDIESDQENEEEDQGSDREDYDAQEVNDTQDVEENDKPLLVRENQGFRAEAEYQGNGSWRYRAEGDLLNSCYEYRHQVAEPEDLENEPMMLEIEILPPDEKCDRAEKKSVAFSGQYEAPKEATFGLTVDVDAEPRIVISDGLVARARYTEQGEWTYSVEGELPDDCWDHQKELKIDDDEYPEVVELVMFLRPPEDGIGCETPYYLYIEDKFNAGPRAEFDFIVKEEKELEEESVQQDAEDQEDQEDQEDEKEEE